jgi:hypothetical protein
MSTNTRTLMARDLIGAAWFKSSYSGNGVDCVEAADLTRTAGHAVAIRDSKDPDGPALLFAPDAFAAFIGDVQRGRFGHSLFG